MNAADFMRKAASSLRAARLLFDNGFMDDASSRVYYAMFDAARETGEVRRFVNGGRNGSDGEVLQV